MIIPLSNILLEPGEATVDHMLASVAHIRKTMGSRTYTAWTEARHVRRNGTLLACYGQIINDPAGQKPAQHVVIIDEYNTWHMEPQHFHQLQWVNDPAPQQHNLPEGFAEHLKAAFPGTLLWEPCCLFDPTHAEKNG